MVEGTKRRVLDIENEEDPVSSNLVWCREGYADLVPGL